MKFLTDFCNHTGSESDTVRRGLSKKIGTAQYLPKIHDGFISFMRDNYGESEEHSEEILKSFLKVIDDASRYGFSDNHSTPYSFIGYIGAYLRYYYPYEFLTVALNLQDDDKEKTSKIVKYAKMKNIKIKPIQFGKSRASYSFVKEENSIYKGIASIKFLNVKVSEELYELSKRNYSTDKVLPLFTDIINETSADTRQMEILIRLDFFKEFGAKEILLELFLTMSDKKKPDTKRFPQFADKVVIEKKTNKKTGEVTEKKKTVKCPMKYSPSLKEKTRLERLQNLEKYEEALRENPPRKIELFEQIAFEKEKLGYAESVFPSVDSHIAIVLDINRKYTPKVTLYQVKTGVETVVKIDKKKFWKNEEDDLLYVGDIIQIIELEERDGWINQNGKWLQDPSKKEWFLNKQKIIRQSKYRN